MVTGTAVALAKRYKGTEVATSADIVATYWNAYCPYKWRRVDDEELLQLERVSFISVRPSVKKSESMQIQYELLQDNNVITIISTINDDNVNEDNNIKDSTKKDNTNKIITMTKTTTKPKATKT